MILRTPALFFLLAALFACATATPEKPSTGEDDRVPPTPRGLTIREYEGTLEEHPPVTANGEELSETAARVADLVSRRIGLTLDPDRPRILGVDEVPASTITTRLVKGRTTQVLSLPLDSLVRGSVPLREELAVLLTRATLSDFAKDELPGWYIKGAPLWVSGAWERALYSRILNRPVLPSDVDEVTAPVLLDRGGNDPLSAALFFRFLAEEFGAERIPALSRALLSAPTHSEAFGAALGADPQSLPLAFESYRARVVSQILTDDFVRLLGASRKRPPATRIPSLSGLAGRASNRFVASALLSELALAQFEAGEFTEAATTFARVERDYTLHSLSPDRDLLFFALTFARTGDPEGARIRLDAFRVEYPESRFASLALLELAAIDLANGEADSALKRYEEVTERFPESAHSLPAHLILAATARTSYRYGYARRHLTAALPDEGAKRELAELDAELASGLPEAAKPAVRSAVRDLLGKDEVRANAAVEFLADVGPAAREELATPFLGRQQFGRTTTARRRALRVIRTWPGDQAWPDPLVDFLHGDDSAVAADLFDILAALGVSEAEIENAMDRVPFAITAAAAEFDRRFRSETATEALARSDLYRDRVVAAERLATEEHPAVLELLTRLLADKSPQVRRVAASSLGIREEEEAVRILYGRLDDASRLVRAEVLRSLARHEVLEPTRRRGLTDADAAVRIECARILLDNDDSEDVVLVIGLLNDKDGMVRTAVEELLHEEDSDVLGAVLARALVQSDLPGHSVRIVRLMTYHTGIEFGYDAYGGPEERERVAEAFRKAWPRRKKQ